jgi:Ser-tRNA(Ala) deacylase AlaX
MAEEVLKMGKPVDIGEIYIMSSKKKYSGFQGLCSTCNNASTCTFPRNHLTFIWQCDEFDDSTPEKGTHKKKTKSAASFKKAEANKNSDDTVRYKGLCINCENRATCTHLPSEGGVWHCEDYL